jgi:glycosyltransferase involved in cell wall biosynthesis
MFLEKKVVVVMPAYNAASTLVQTHEEVMAQGVVDEVVLVDDCSTDDTVEIARNLDNTRVHRHEENLGYGGNQKTCYRLALEMGADIVVMVHPDYQYTPKLIPAMVSVIGNGLYPCVLASRILGGSALHGGMPWWRYVANRGLTLAGNVLMSAKLSEFHTGYRAFSREILEKLPLDRNSNDFVFDNQMIAQILWYGYPIAEVTCPTKYFTDASSINFMRSVQYGFGCLGTAALFRLSRMGLARSPLFPPEALLTARQAQSSGH